MTLWVVPAVPPDTTRHTRIKIDVLLVLPLSVIVIADRQSSNNQRQQQFQSRVIACWILIKFFNPFSLFAPSWLHSISVSLKGENLFSLSSRLDEKGFCVGDKVFLAFSFETFSPVKRRRQIDKDSKSMRSKMRPLFNEINNEKNLIQHSIEKQFACEHRVRGQNMQHAVNFFYDSPHGHIIFMRS